MEMAAVKAAAVWWRIRTSQAAANSAVVRKTKKRPAAIHSVRCSGTTAAWMMALPTSPATRRSRRSSMDIPQNRGGMHYEPPVSFSDASQA